ncbi:MAG: MFS transporter [Rhodospirillales bacterium]|nr:MFS transporter [Rhodospirillales bacterium]
MTGSPRQSSLVPGLLIFAFCLLMIAASRGMGETYAVFLLPLSVEFGWNRASVTSVYAVYMVAFGFGCLLSGIVYDRLGPRFNYLIGLVLLVSCYGFAGSGWLTSLAAFYLVIGICGGVGAAMVGVVPMQSLISKWFFRGRATALSIAYSGQGIGVMLLAPTAQFTIDRVGWQGAYLQASFGFLVILVLVMLLPWRRMAAGLPGAGPSSAPHKPEGKAPSVPARPAAGLSLGQAVRRVEFWGFFTIYAASAISIFSISLQVVAFLVDQNFSVVHAAFAFGCMGMLTILGIALTGILSARYPRHLVATASYVLTLIGILALAALPFYPGWLLLAVFVLCFGLSAGARGPIITAQMVDMFAGPGLASIFGATNIGQGCGAALGAFMAGYLFDLTGGYNAGFVMSLLFALLGLSMFWLVPGIRHGRVPG